MTTHFVFLEWPVYQEARRLYVFCQGIVKGLPKEYRYEVGSQILRSSLFVSANIAEGKGKNSDKDFNHYLNISLGSLNETVAHADALRESGLVTKGQFDKLTDIAISISNQLGGFKKKLSGVKSYSS